MQDMNRRYVQIGLTFLGIFCSWWLLNIVVIPHSTDSSKHVSVSRTSSTRPALSPAFLDSLKQTDPKRAYTVKHVVDGDTVTVSFNSETVTVRMLGVDTPETVDPRKMVQCFGKEASNKTKELLVGTASSTALSKVEVYLETDPSQGLTDKYGRLLAYVTRANDDLFINRYLVSEGYAHEYTYNIPYKYQIEFKEAEKMAREKEKGLWGYACR